MGKGYINWSKEKYEMEWWIKWNVILLSILRMECWVLVWMLLLFCCWLLWIYVLCFFEVLEVLEEDLWILGVFMVDWCIVMVIKLYSMLMNIMGRIKKKYVEVRNYFVIGVCLNVYMVDFLIVWFLGFLILIILYWLVIGIVVYMVIIYM